MLVKYYPLRYEETEACRKEITWPKPHNKSFRVLDHKALLHLDVLL